MQRNFFLAASFAATALAGCGQPARQVAPSTGFAADFGFFYVDDGGNAKLAYGAAQSDNVGLMLECAKGSRVIQVTDMVRSAPAPRLTLTSAGRATTVPADVETGEGGSIVVTHVASTAPALSGFRRSGTIEVTYAGLRYAISARPYERPSVGRFFDACDGRAAQTLASRAAVPIL